MMQRGMWVAASEFRPDMIVSQAVVRGLGIPARS